MTGSWGRFFVFLVLVVGFLPAAGAWGAPIQWGPYGHYYEAFLVPEGVNWSDAETLAENAGGYLAAIGSWDEDLFALSLVSRESHPEFWYKNAFNCWMGPWLGGYLNEGVWSWVNGEPWVFSSWAGGEPSGYGENSLHFFYNSGGGGLWNDVSEFELIRGYIVEFDQNPAAVPLPAAVWLLGSGLMALMGFKGRKKFF